MGMVENGLPGVIGERIAPAAAVGEVVSAGGSGHHTQSSLAKAQSQLAMFIDRKLRIKAIDTQEISATD
jgi:hypothetical protein